MRKIRKFNKKAIMFSALLFVFGLVIFGKIYTSLEGKTVELTAGKIVGQKELAIIDAVYQAEKVMLFNDQLSKYVMFDTIFHFADKGAFSRGCGVHGDALTGYTIWKTKSQECYPTIGHLKKNFAGTFSALFYGKINHNPYFNYSKRGVFKHYDYSVDVENGKTILRGYPFTPFVNSISCEYGGEHVPTSWIDKPLPLIGRIFAPDVQPTTALCGNYVYRPSFSHSIHYDLGEYVEIAGKANATYNDCKASTDLIKCVNNKVSQLTDGDFSWNVTSYGASSEGIIFDLEVVQKNFRFALYDKPVVRFAIVIPLP